MDYNLGELESLFDEIKEIIDYVDKNKLTYKNYFLYLANLKKSENIEYQITNESLPHLLGINTTNLIATKIYSSKNSYQVTLEMLDDPYRLYKAVKDGVITYDKIFSKHIKKKIKAFKNNVNMNAHNMTAISKYYPDRTYTNAFVTEKFEYTIIREYEDGSIGLLCLAKNYEGIYVPMSNQLLEPEEEKNNILEKILRNQEITYVTSINLQSNPTIKTFITFDEKIDRLYKLRDYKSKYNVSIDVHNDSLYFMDKLKNNKTVFAQSEVSTTIVEQSKEIETLKKNIDELRQLRAELEQLNRALSSENQQLKNEANKNNEFKVKLLKLVKELED